MKPRQGRRATERGGAPERRETSSRPADPEAFAAAVLVATDAAVDSSSLIVLADIGVLPAAAAFWRLATVPAVATEIGALAATVSLRLLPEPGAADADRALVAAAAAAKLAVLSEDMKILRAAEDRGLTAFDSLVALEVLAASGALPPPAAAAARRRLLARNAYPPRRLSWAESVAAALAKLG